MTILALVKHYLPGYKSGGPLRTIANIVEHLGDEFRFVVLTRDRDSGDLEPYPGVQGRGFHRVGKAEVMYLKPSMMQPIVLQTVVGAVRPDVLYVNSFFSFEFGILPVALRRLNLFPAVPLVLAPRGEFSPGALALSQQKKSAFLRLSNCSRLHRGITWQASSPFEAGDIRRCILTTREGSRLPDPIVVAPDVLPPPGVRQVDRPRTKAAGRARVLFLSRLAPKKNLLGALHILSRVTGSVEFTIAGPVEDRRYWAACQTVVHRLPPNIKVRHVGAVAHSEVSSLMAEHDLFFFPTLGENYGHVIVEALLAGCPVLTSDQTPWRCLEAAHVGWDIPLDQPDRFRAVLEDCIAMDAVTFATWSARARAFACERAADPAVVEASRALFRLAGTRGYHRVGADLAA